MHSPLRNLRHSRDEGTFSGMTFPAKHSAIQRHRDEVSIMNAKFTAEHTKSLPNTFREAAAR